MLSFETMAVTIVEADTYCAERGIADCTGDNTAKAAALRRGQDYIAGAYNTRWITAFENASAPTVVKFAIIEAATREIKVPFSLTPDIVMGREKVLTKVGPMGWTPLKSESTAADLVPVLTSIRNLLRGTASVDPVSGALVV